MTTVLFACVHNAGRSQMASAFFNALADPTAARAVSAGTQPASHVHEEVVTVMREEDIDLADATPKHLSEALSHRVDIIVTMGCGEACPVVPGARHVEWEIEDPKGQPLPRVRSIRDDLRRRVTSLIEELAIPRANRP